jgi:hypothetical protein
MDFPARRWHSAIYLAMGTVTGMKHKHQDPGARQRMVALLENLAPLEGYNLTALPDVRFLRSNRPLAARRCCTTRAW